MQKIFNWPRSKLIRVISDGIIIGATLIIFLVFLFPFYQIKASGEIVKGYQVFSDSRELVKTAAAFVIIAGLMLAGSVVLDYFLPRYRNYLLFIRLGSGMILLFAMIAVTIFLLGKGMVWKPSLMLALFMSLFAAISAVIPFIQNQDKIIIIEETRSE